MPVGAGIERVGPLAAAYRPRGVVGGRKLVQHPEHRLEKREIDDLAEARPLPLAKRHQHAERPVHARHVVAERGRAGRHRRAAREAGEVSEPAEGMGDAGEARPLAVGPGLAVAGDPQHDEARIGSRQFVIAEAPALHCAGAEVLAHDIRIRREPPEQGRPFRRAQVERDRPLVARLAQPGEGAVGAGARRAVAPPGIACGLFDLDDLRAELAEDRRRVRAGDESRRNPEP